MANKTLIFTALDGALLDSQSHSTEVVQPLVAKLKDAGVPIVFVSSKTRVEQEYYLDALNLSVPFIAEDGGAIFIPKGYFDSKFEHQRETDEYQVIEMAKPYAEVRQRLEAVRAQGHFAFRGYGDMGTPEVAEISGLDMLAASRAQKREYQEAVNLTGSEDEINLILNYIEKANLSYVKLGRFYGVMFGNYKGPAVRLLMELFRQKLGDITTIGVGESINDLPLLVEMDKPVLVGKADGSHQAATMPNLHLAKESGPHGWVEAISELTGIKP